MPKIQVSLPDGNEFSHELTDEVTTIGRVTDNVLQIEDASVSSHHAEVRLVDGKYHLTDLGSTNGTRVNDQEFTEWQLDEGDRVRFGNVETVFTSRAVAATKPLPAEESHAIAPAAESHRPESFANASPFKTKKKKQDPATLAVLGFTGVAFLAFVWAVFSILMLQAPK